ncbi:hypothetical protein [Rhizobium leguminosarum]|uniref:hypothetical protein n=1 Tax=Rhizobium leguminosarum TaxID=384 RepID=UPI003159B258
MTTGLVAARVAGVVEAGTFREVDEFDQSEPIEVMLPRDEKFPNARQLLFDCSGGQHERSAPSPDFSRRPAGLHFLRGRGNIWSSFDLEWSSLWRRTRDSGHFREWSVKQLELFGDRAELHPRSTNPEAQADLSFNAITRQMTA